MPLPVHDYYERINQQNTIVTSGHKISIKTNMMLTASVCIICAIYVLNNELDLSDINIQETFCFVCTYLLYLTTSQIFFLTIGF